MGSGAASATAMHSIFRKLEITAHEIRFIAVQLNSQDSGWAEHFIRFKLHKISSQIKPSELKYIKVIDRHFMLFLAYHKN
jgi:hypothetical protein